MEIGAQGVVLPAINQTSENSRDDFVCSLNQVLDLRSPWFLIFVIARVAKISEKSLGEISERITEIDSLTNRQTDHPMDSHCPRLE
jgi:hypothetical protein